MQNKITTDWGEGGGDDDDDDGDDEDEVDCAIEPSPIFSTLLTKSPLTFSDFLRLLLHLYLTNHDSSLRRKGGRAV